MRWIKKKKSPDPFERWKAQAKPQSWNQLPGTLPDARSPHYHYYSKDELRAVLLKEQNSKCLYCESCISNHPSKTRVDHVKTPQALAQTSEQIFDYRNLGLSCNSEYLHRKSENESHNPYCPAEYKPEVIEKKTKGDRKKIHPDALHCDAHKKDEILPFTPYDHRCEEELQFLSDGSILSKNPDGKKVIKILNLNAVQLRNRRQKAIEGFISDQNNGFIDIEIAEELYDKLLRKKSLKYSKAILDSLKKLF